MNKEESQQEDAQNSEDGLTRKDFLTRISLSIAGISAAVMAVPVVSALVAPLLESSESLWRTVGRVEDFSVGSTNLVTFENADPEPYAGELAKSAAWLRRIDNSSFAAFAINCSHLGCPVRWEESAQLFMCPCHGGVYYRDGSVAAGPPPRGLTEYKVRVRNDEVQLQTAPLPITSV
ncbi:MAG TPA: Rieske 2Fe-2S domain-containing protein [Puia sp.]|nr:Rieske 2Fe-2S domain-containing protein [Puia sp.]